MTACVKLSVLPEPPMSGVLMSLLPSAMVFNTACSNLQADDVSSWSYA